MLKLVCPCACKTFKVLSYCVVIVLEHKIQSNVTQCILLITRAYLIVSEEQITHSSQ